jgi:hypothetical protein
VKRWIDVITPKIAGLQSVSGGPVILLQIENEYLYISRPGARPYMDWLRDRMLEYGVKIPLLSCNHLAVTSEGVIDTFTGNGGFVSALSHFREKFPGHPVFVSEFWDDPSFDVWGKERPPMPPGTLAYAAAGALAARAGYSLYMFHGGTNFGFWAGRTSWNDFSFCVTSYDRSAPVTEDGRPRASYYAMKTVNSLWSAFSDIILEGEHSLSRGERGTTACFKRDGVSFKISLNHENMTFHCESRGLDIDGDKLFNIKLETCPDGKTRLSPDKSYESLVPEIKKTYRAHVLTEGSRRLSTELLSFKKTGFPKAMEELGVFQGYGVYRARFHSERAGKTDIFIPNMDDRCRLTVNGGVCGVAGRGVSEKILKAPLKSGVNELDFFIDDLGHCNFGLRSGEAKGIRGDVYLKARELKLAVIDNRAAKYPDLAGAELGELYCQGWRGYEIPAPNMPCALRGLSFPAESGSGAMLFMSGMKGRCVITVNGYPVVSHHPPLNVSGYYEPPLDRFLRPGENIVSVYAPEDEMDTLCGGLRLVVYELGSRLAGEWFFAPVPDRPKEFSSFSAANEPAWHRCSFDRPEGGGTFFLSVTGLGKGQIYLNKKNIGRYWSIGPQYEYYLPSCWLKKKNELIIFDEEGKSPEKCEIVLKSL